MRAETSFLPVPPGRAAQAWPADPATEVERCSWPVALEAAIAGDELRCWFQPIVDVVRGVVVGYEALARIEGPAGPVGPGPWLTAARVHGLSAELESACLSSAFAHRASLPPGCFLSVNVGPHVLAHPTMRAVLAAQGDLHGVVLELTGDVPLDAYAEAARDLERYRLAGARIAIDGDDAERAGVERLRELRPAIVKVDRAVLAGIDTDENKRAALRRLGALAREVDAHLVAEGVERVEELEVLMDLRVTFVQGYALARPAPPWRGIDPAVADRMRQHAPSHEGEDPAACSTPVTDGPPGVAPAGTGEP